MPSQQRGSVVARKKKMVLAATTVLSICLPAAPPSRAEDVQAPIRIGVLTDMAGMYRDIMGPGSVVAAKMAVEDFGGKVLGRPIEVISGDHQAKPDVGAAIARDWFDNGGVDVIVDVAQSAVALAVQELARSRNKIVIHGVTGTPAITQRAVRPEWIGPRRWLADASVLYGQHQEPGRNQGTLGLLQPRKTIPETDAALPLAQSQCPLVAESQGQ
jgi:hypothetical protein